MSNSELRLPRTYHFPRYSVTAASEIFDLMDGLGRPLFPWQKFVIENGLGQVETPTLDLEWAASQCGCWVPRQNGKGDVIMALELGWLFLFNERLVLHSAHEYKTAQEGFLRIRDVIKGSRDLDRLVKRYWQANGEQGIELKSGSRLRFMARTRGGGRGFSAARIILDEAQELIEAQMAAIGHVISAQKNWQIWFFGTPPRPTIDGGLTSDAWIYNLKKLGEAGADRVAWFDWGVETLDFENPDTVKRLRDPRTWLETNPSLGNLIDMRTVEDQVRLMHPGVSFAMERCGMWLPEAGETSDASIEPENWEACATPDRTKPSKMAFAFYVNPMRTHATIAFAGMMNGRWRVGLIAHKKGTDWLFPRLQELKTRHDPILFAVDAKSETTVDDLKEIGIKTPEVAEKPEHGDLYLPTSSDVASAYGLFVDTANSRGLDHFDELPLNKAVTAPPRPLAGGATWDHKKGIEVGPAVAVGLAMKGYRDWVDKVRRNYDPLANIW